MQPQKIGVIGSGQIGPDIALHFSKVFHGQGVSIVVVDVSKEALSRGQAKLEKKIDRGVESGAFSPSMGQAMKKSVAFTGDYEDMRGVDFVVEAASEDLALKQRIFGQLEGLVSGDAVLASNSSHLEPEKIFAQVSDKSRTLVIHYFFPAERNPIVEVVPGAETSPQLAAKVMKLYESIGKFPIQVGSRYGYAIDPVFEGMFLACALLVEEGAGTTKEVDAAAVRTLRYTVGPFTAMNLTGGNPISNKGLELEGEHIMPWFRSPDILKRACETGEAWDVPRRGETVELPADREQRIANDLLGAYFGMVGELLDSGITNVADLEMALPVALDMAAPFALMNKLGVGKSLELVKDYARRHDGFKVADSLKEQATSGKPWDIPLVLRRDVDGVAIVTVRRPKVLNAMNGEAFSQLERHFTDIKNDDSVVGAVLTGFGVKAFIAGADVKFLARLETREAGEAQSAESNRQVKSISDCGKPVVCAMNGLAFGGGNEMAMACSARIATKGLKVLAGQPEVNLGIIPGAGGTQRLPRLVGMQNAATMMRTGKPISGARALQWGLIAREVEGDVVAEAIAMVKRAADGKEELPGLDSAAMDVPAKLDDVELGHLSRAVDAILCRALLEGCAQPLDDGLAFEAKMFGEVCTTRDMRIGVTSFIENGPSRKADFVHE